ncbi:hypothetical protein CCMA1212_005999 [Trichoderma ghanense]|uniref:Uncharacterized protein n=1 Tax=Trichoderma ghanense TaxID=65468 RepID=A0ABY2H2G4_9HYPO
MHRVMSWCGNNSQAQGRLSVTKSPLHLHVPSSLTVSATRDNKLEMAHCSSPAVSQLASAKLQQLLSHVVLPSSCTLNCRFVRVSTCSKSAPGRPIR